MITSESSCTIEKGHSSPFKNDRATVFMQIDGLHAAKRLSSRHDGVKQVSGAPSLFLRHQIKGRLTEHFLRLIAENRADFRATVREDCALIDFPPPITRRLHQGTKPSFDILEYRIHPVDDSSASRGTSMFLHWFPAQGSESLPFGWLCGPRATGSRPRWLLLGRASRSNR